MKKFLQIFSALVVSSLLFSSAFTSFAAQDEWTQIEPSEAYADYLKSPDKYDIIPQYYDSEAVDNQAGIPGVPKASEPIELPAKYDVRKDGISPRIKDQFEDSTCSIFTVLGNYEIFTAKNNDIRYFNEYHAKHALAQNFSDGANLFGFDRTPSEGLHLRNVSPYLINGRGPIPSDFSGYAVGDDLVLSEYVNSVKPELQTQEIKVLPGLGAEATAEQTAAWLTELKTLVYTYGSVAITMTSNAYHSDTTGTYYYCSSMPSYHDHAVVCIGWDDTVLAQNFKNRYGKVPEHDGGLIFKNSWGPTYNENGYGYISYDSVGLALQDFQLVTDYRERTDDETVNTYAELGSQSVIGNTSKECKWYGNKFYLDKNEYVTLKEINFYAPVSDIKYDVYISPTGTTNREDFVYISSVTPDYPGYYSVPTDFDLGSSDLSEYFIVVKSNCGSAEYAVPIEGNLSGYQNIYNKYLTYFENDKRVVIPYTTPKGQEMTEQGIEWEILETGFLAMDDGAFSAYHFSNLPVNAITEPYKISINVSAEISAVQAVQGDEITVTAAVGGDGSGSYTYLYKLFFDGECIAESNDETFSFIPKEIGEYYVEVTVTDTVNNITAAAVTETVNVGKGAFEIDCEITDNGDGTFTVNGGTLYPEDGMTYFVYVLSDGNVIAKTVYQPELNFTFNADGNCTVKIYAQNAEKQRVSATEYIG